MNIATIKSDIDFLCGSTSASYPDTAKMRNVNIEYQNVARIIWESAGGWQFDDSNATTLPIAQTALVHNQQHYELPSTCQRVHEVIVTDKDGTDWKLKPMDIHGMATAPSEFFVGDNAGLPVYYDLMGSTVSLYPSPSSAYCTLASGLTLYVDRDVTEFAASATTATPGFATPFHRILSYAAALDFVQDEQTRKNYMERKAVLENGMKKFYSKRGIEMKTAVTPAKKKFWRQYL